MIDLKHYLGEMWSPTDYGIPKLDAYARGNMEPEIRSGVRTLCLVFFILLISSAILNSHLKLGATYLYTYSVMAVLAVHMFWSAQKAIGIKALYLLATTLLVVSSTALVLLAHKTGTYTVPLLVSIVLLFMIIPLVPWGLKESFQVVALVYLVFTLSSWSVRYRFSNDTLILLQFLMTAISGIVFSLIGRNTVVRRKEIQNLYELELVKKKLQKLSCKDPLTGAWNRRYLKTRFEEVRQYHLQRHTSFNFIIFDIDEFKSINDRNGHDYGDQVLQWIVDSYHEHLGPHDILIRMGGDEFVLIANCDEPEKLIHQGLDTLSQKLIPGKGGTEKISLSFGLVRIPSETQIAFKDVYQASDLALYSAKKTKGSHIAIGSLPLPTAEKSPLLTTRSQEYA